MQNKTKKFIEYSHDKNKGFEGYLLRRIEFMNRRFSKEKFHGFLAPRIKAERIFFIYSVLTKI